MRIEKKKGNGKGRFQRMWLSRRQVDSLQELDVARVGAEVLPFRIELHVRNVGVFRVTSLIQIVERHVRLEQ